jgi:hypothetical protein
MSKPQPNPSAHSDGHRPTLQVKSILLSKTFWVQFLALLSLLVPVVREWLESNPVELVAVFAAVNVLVRFATSGKVSVFPPEEVASSKQGSSGGMVPCVIGVMAVGSLVVSLPSCSPAQISAVRAIPIRVCATYHGVEVCAQSAK